MQTSPWLARSSAATAIDYRGGRLAARLPAEMPGAAFPATALLDWSFRAALRLHGADARKWLNGIVTANARDLAPGHSTPSFLLNPKGHILAQFDLVALAPDQFLLLASEDQKSPLLENLRRFIFRSRVEIEDLSPANTSLAVAGPGAAAALSAAGLAILPVQAGQSASLAVAGGGPLLALRWILGQIDTIEIFGALDTVVPYYDSLRAFTTPAGVLAWDRRLLLEGIPLSGRDIRETTLPQETGHMEAIGHNKGCYIGQEIVERIRARGQVHRQFRGFRFVSAVAAGDRIRAGDQPAGEITAVTALSAGAHAGQWAALGYLRHDAEESPAPLSTIGGVAGQLAPFPLDA